MEIFGNLAEALKRALFIDPLLINLPQAIQNQVCISGGFDGYRKAFGRLLKIENASGNFDDLTKGLVSSKAAALRTHDLPFVKKDPSSLRVLA